MARVRFTVRGMMIAVAVTALILGVALAFLRREPISLPRDAGEAVDYLRRFSPGLFRGDYDLDIRRVRHGEAVGSQYGAAFQVTFIRRERSIGWHGAGAKSVREKVSRQVILIMEDGYCMHLSY